MPRALPAVDLCRDVAEIDREGVGLMVNQLCMLMLVVSILNSERVTALLKSLQGTTERGKDGAVVRIALPQSDVTDDDISIIASAIQLHKLDQYGTRSGL